MQDKRQKVIFLFDVNDTLVPSGGKLSSQMKKMLLDVKKHVFIGFVSGATQKTILNQLEDESIQLFDFCFPENGLSFYKKSHLVSQKKMIDEIGEQKYQKLVNFILSELSKIVLPFKRGNFIEYRSSLINISPCGKNCTEDEIKRFSEYDSIKKVRESLVETLKENFDQHDIHFSIGGRISIDCFPKKWDKRYCIGHLHEEEVFDIIFFGRMTHLNGNDFEIFEDERVKEVAVEGPEDTLKKVYEKIEGYNNAKEK